MKELIIKLIEQAKESNIHEIGQCIDRSFISNGFINMSKEEINEITKLLEDNNCTMQTIMESTMCPKITVKYHG